jgi:hypothetical protein
MENAVGNVKAEVSRLKVRKDKIRGIAQNVQDHEES